MDRSYYFCDDFYVHPHPRVYIQRDSYIGDDHKEHARWEVRYCDDNTIYAYAFTWYGAWRLACAAVGWKVPE